MKKNILSIFDCPLDLNIPTWVPINEKFKKLDKSLGTVLDPSTVLNIASTDVFGCGFSYSSIPNAFQIQVHSIFKFLAHNIFLLKPTNGLEPSPVAISGYECRMP
jgi:hypothetical protein